jgi:branched-chain amino acid transport system ATP-binding protein
MTEPILETRALRKEFGGLVAVDDVSLQVEAGLLHAIIGPNGAGKTTFFNLLSGNLPPTRGQVFYKGQDITEVPLHRRAHLGIGRSFQITNVFPNLTVLENVRLAAQARGSDNFKIWRHYRGFSSYESRAASIVQDVGLGGKELQLARLLPHGDKRKLELAILLALDPELLLLDEPTAGMASEQVPELMSIIRQIKDTSGKTIMLVEHNMSVIMGFSDRISVMHQGALLAEGTPAEIAANETVQDAYLGQLYGDFGELTGNSGETAQ